MYNCILLNQISLNFVESFAKHRKDLSAIMLTPQKHIWLGSDESSSIERLSLIENNKFADHQQFRVAEFIDLPAPESEEIDIEGLAYADYYLWLVGSHSYKRQKPKSKYTDVKIFKD